MILTIHYEQEADGRWLAEVRELPGILAYGKDPENAIARAQALALRVVADQVENGQAIPALIFSYSVPQKSEDDGWERLMKLKDELGKGWQSEKSAVEILFELRR